MDSGDENEDTPKWQGVPATIILIDSRVIEVGHVATCSAMRKYLRASSSQYISVCVYGINNTNVGEAGFKNVLEVFPLTTLGLDEFQKLRDIDVASVECSNQLVLSEALWHCSLAFRKCNKQLSSKTVVLLSKYDNPPVEDDRKAALNRVSALVEDGIEMKIVNVSQEPYEIHDFYKNFLHQIEGPDYIVPKHIWAHTEIAEIIHQHSHRNLAVAKLCFDIGNDISIGVGLYSLLKSHTYIKKHSLDRETNASVTSVTKETKVTVNRDEEMDVDEAETEPKQVSLLKSEKLYTQEYGGERVEFTSDERKAMQNPFGPPQLKLLGFKPKHIMCKEKWFLKSGYFLFPNEGLVEGSTVAIKAMHAACVETGMVAVCVLCSRVNSRPNIVALSPCTNPLGLEVDLGFDVIPLPFVEHLRELVFQEEDEPIDVSEEQKTVMSDILKSIIFDYKPDMFENPKIQSEYRAIEAIALEEEDIEPFIDTTKPNDDNFKNIPADVFEELFGPFGAAPKRQNTSNSGGPSQKKPKLEIDEDELQERLRFKTIDKYTVKQLQEVLKSRKQDGVGALTGLKKSDLVALVYKHYS